MAGQSAAAVDFESFVGDQNPEAAAFELRFAAVTASPLIAVQAAGRSAGSLQSAVVARFAVQGHVQMVASAWTEAAESVEASGLERSALV